MLLRAITTPPEGSPPRGVQIFIHDGLTVWASEMSGPFTKEDLLEHHRIVSEIFARVNACLPMRFPTLTEDLSSLDPVVFAEQLERVRDACELAITAVWVDASAPQTGREYLLRRAHAEGVADDIEACIGDALLDASRAVCPSSKVAVSLAALVRRDHAETVKARIPRGAVDVRILVNGPWPPYTFADPPRLGTRKAST